MGRWAERETRKQSLHVSPMGSGAFGLLAPPLQCPGPTHRTPVSCEVEGDVWSAPWRWYSTTTERLQTGKQKSYRKTTTPSYDSQVAVRTFTRDRNRMNTETQWCKVSVYWIKSEFLIKFVTKLLAGNCCWIIFCTVLLNSDSCCHLPFLSVLFSLFITSSLLLGCEPRGQPECLHLGVAQSSSHSCVTCLGRWIYTFCLDVILQHPLLL